jgi:putative SOS response-associated peptidase YedK
VPIILRGADGTLEGETARWGLIPHWWKQPEPPSRTFNARSEEAAGKPTWRDAMKSRRCLLPASGWYEWHVTPAGGKQPYFVHLPGEQMLAFAGLWSRWKPAEGEPVLSCAVLTKDAAPSIALIHHRMPVVLKPEHYAEWLDPATPPARVQELIADARADLEGHPVSTKVNNTRNNTPDLVDRIQAVAG